MAHTHWHHARVWLAVAPSPTPMHVHAACCVRDVYGFRLLRAVVRSGAKCGGHNGRGGHPASDTPTRPRAAICVTKGAPRCECRGARKSSRAAPICGGDRRPAEKGGVQFRRPERARRQRSPARAFGGVHQTRAFSLKSGAGWVQTRAPAALASHRGLKSAGRAPSERACDKVWVVRVGMAAPVSPDAAGPPQIAQRRAKPACARRHGLAFPGPGRAPQGGWGVLGLFGTAGQRRCARAARRPARGLARPPKEGRRARPQGGGRPARPLSAPRPWGRCAIQVHCGGQRPHFERGIAPPRARAGAKPPTRRPARSQTARANRARRRMRAQTGLAGCTEGPLGPCAGREHPKSRPRRMRAHERRRAAAGQRPLRTARPAARRHRGATAARRPRSPVSGSSRQCAQRCKEWLAQTEGSHRLKARTKARGWHAWGQAEAMAPRGACLGAR
jgi:hypothetical protein